MSSTVIKTLGDQWSQTGAGEGHPAKHRYFLKSGEAEMLSPVF